MTSNVSFWTNVKENFKRRSWTTMLLGLYFFIIYMVTPIIFVSQMSSPHGPMIPEELEYIRSSFNTLMSFNFATGSIMAIFAVLFALHGYSYLFSRKKIDLYLSVPISAKRRFFVIQVTGILTFIVLYLIFAGIGFLVGSLASLVTLTTIKLFLVSFMLNILLFIAVYELTTIAVMMTGHTIVSILAFGVFSVYELLLRLLHRSYLNSFMSHLVYEDFGETLFTSPFYPYYLLIDQVNRIDFIEAFDYGLFIQNTLWLVLHIIIFFAIAYFLYRKRPNEASDRAISFPKTKPVINIALQILAGLGGGLFLYSISYSSYAMAVFGIFLGCLLMFFTMNIIFEFDIRSIFKHWRTFFISITIAVIYFIIITTDVFGIDTYIPDKEDIVSCGISSYELNPIGYTNNQLNHWDVTREDSSCTMMALENVEPFIELAELGLESYQPRIYSGYRNYTICFHLENGRTVYRLYNIPDEEAFPALEEIFTSSEYVESTNRMLDENAIEIAMAPYFNNGVYDTEVPIDAMNEIIETYKKDLNYLTFEDNILKAPIAKWQFYGKKYNYIELPIYENFSYTLDLLNEYDLEEDLKVNPDEIATISLYLHPITYEEDYGTNAGDPKEEAYIDLSTNLSITDPEEIRILMESATSSIFRSFDNSNYTILQSSGVEYSVEMYVFPKHDTPHEEELHNTHFNFYGDLPEFIGENYYLNY